MQLGKATKVEEIINNKKRLGKKMMFVPPGFAYEIRRWNRIRVCKERGKPKENTTYFQCNGTF